MGEFPDVYAQKRTVSRCANGLATNERGLTATVYDFASAALHRRLLARPPKAAENVFPMVVACHELVALSDLFCQ